MLSQVHFGVLPSLDARSNLLLQVAVMIEDLHTTLSVAEAAKSHLML